MKLLKFVGSAAAALVLSFTNSAGANPLTLDLAAGPGNCSTTGTTSPLILAVATGSVCWGTNDFAAEVATGFNFSTPGSPSIDLALNGNYTGTGAYGLTAFFTIQDLSVGASPTLVTLTGSITNNGPQPGVSWAICVDDANGVGSGVCTATAVPGSTSSLTLATTVTGTYSITIFEYLNPKAPVGVGSSGYSLDGGTHLQAPEPGTLALLGIALAGLGFVGFRRRS